MTAHSECIGKFEYVLEKLCDSFFVQSSITVGVFCIDSFIGVIMSCCGLQWDKITHIYLTPAFLWPLCGMVEKRGIDRSTN